MDNSIYIPKINPVKFVQSARENLPKYFTKHLDDFLFSERQYYWQQPEDYAQIWQTTDIISLQFESDFEPIIVTLVDENNRDVITLPALIGLPNKFYAGTYSYEVNMSLAGVSTGCYYLNISCGTGSQQINFISGMQYISSVQIENSLCIEYYNSVFHGDVMFETGIKFQHRLFGWIGFLTPTRQDQMYKNQEFTPTLLSSKLGRQFPINFGDNFGIPDDVVDLLNRIWSCDNVSIDNKLFCISDGSKFEFIDLEMYPKRGLKITVEEGVNRNSIVVSSTQDVTKKLNYGIMVDKKVFGDLGTQGSNNTVPIIKII